MGSIPTVGRPRPSGRGSSQTAAARGVPVGWRGALGVGLLALIALWAAGSLLSFIVNRQQIVSATQRVQLLRQPVVNDQQLIDLQVLRNDIGRSESARQRHARVALWS